jgi:hypothetical protein
MLRTVEIKICLQSTINATAISRDEGKTFIHQRNISRDPDDDFGYQCIEFVKGDIATQNPVSTGNVCRVVNTWIDKNISVWINLAKKTSQI